VALAVCLDKTSKNLIESLEVLISLEGGSFILVTSITVSATLHHRLTAKSSRVGNVFRSLSFTTSGMNIRCSLGYLPTDMQMRKKRSLKSKIEKLTKYVVALESA
jgi:hypothetical protein